MKQFVKRIFIVLSKTKSCWDPEELYCRWIPFGFLTSHTRAHGAPPTEPWLYESERVQNTFRLSAEMKYKLMPYVYAQAKECTEKGLSMTRPLFMEF
mgnify:CR=1 FL=1